jgi:tripartite-type tricarboxylate transporter receptor subunit TctC
VIPRRAVLAGTGAAVITRRRAEARRFITMVTAAPPGSNGDEIARLFAQFLARALDGPEIQVRNVPGDGGRTALSALADAPPSGGTIGWVATPVLPARVVDRGDPRLLTRLSLLGSVQREPIAFVASAADPLESVRDIIQRASQDSGGLPLGTPPPGSPSHLAVLRLQLMTQTRLNIIAFPSAASARQALLGGNVTAAALGLSDVIAALRDEKLVGLGIAAKKRSGILPDLPILSEAGVPLSAWIRRGLAVPADTPREVTETLIAALKSVADDTAFRDQSEALGLLAAWSDGPAWTLHAEQERDELAALWAADPWLNAAGQ